MRLVTATLVVFGLLWGAEASGEDVGKVEESDLGAAPNAIARIITLIKGMKTEIIKDGKLEQQLFDKYQCWTERSVKESRATIAESEDALARCESEINEKSAQIATAQEEIRHAEQNIAANEKSQKDATEHRNQEKEDFEMEINNDMAKMGALEKTLEILQANKASTGHENKDDNNMPTTTVHDALISKNMEIISNAVVADPSMSQDDKEAVINFAKAPAQFFQSKAGRVKAYESQSAGIIGIMKSMLLATASDAQERSMAEIKATSAYQALMRTLIHAHGELSDELEAQQGNLAKAEKIMADRKAEQADNEKLLAETEAFLADTTEAGKEKAKEWALRSQLRLEELKNIDQGVAILSDIGGDDEQAFNKPGEGSFLQLGSMSKFAKMQRTLAEVAMEFGSKDVTKLVAASRTTTGDWKEAMWKITEMIDRMIKDHRAQGAADRELRQNCENHLQKLKSEELGYKNRESHHQASMDALDEEMTQNDNKMSELQTQMNTDTTTLDTMNSNADQATTKMRSDLGAREHAMDKIKQAIDVLGASCAANALVQEPPAAKEGQYANDKKKAPKAEFSGAGKHCQSTQGLISILQMVLQDLHNEAKELKGELGVTASETQAQGEDLRSAISTAAETKASLAQENADMGEQKDVHEQKRDTNKAMKESTATQFTTDKDTCKIVLNEDTYSKRQAERETEVEALNYAKTVLTTGASGNAGNDFLQVSSKKFLVARH